MTDEEKTTITAGHVVQINPRAHLGPFKSCFAVVKEAKNWGVVAYIAVPKDGQIQKIDTQLQWKEIELIGVKRFV